MRRALSLTTGFFVFVTSAVAAACAPQERIASTPPAAPQVIYTIRNDPPMSSAQAYQINKKCFAGWSGLREVSRGNGESQKQSLLLEAAEAALKRGIAAGAVDGVSPDQVRVDFENRAAIAKGDKRVAAADFLSCSLVYPAPGETK